MKALAHLNAEGVVKICASKEAIGKTNTSLNFRPCVGRLDPSNAIQFMGDLQFSSTDYMVVELNNRTLHDVLLKQPGFTLSVNVDLPTGKVTWT
jgi:hypothetical protein